ncbi:MAG: hypothetical protein O7D91_21405 [Planctomycetota bacterium]|nr:hypothetical protein [Planctomycetota bacterium]
MAIDLISGTGLMDRLGKLQNLLNGVNDSRGSESIVAAWPRELNRVLVLYDGEVNTIRETVEPMLEQLGEAQQAVDDWTTNIQTGGQNTLIEMADADKPLPSKSVTEAIDELIRQMLANSDTVDAAEPTLAVAAGSANVGTGTLVATIVDGSGKIIENVFEEFIEVRVEDTASAGDESWLYAGEEVEGNKLDFDWPKGSGASFQQSTIEASAASIITNGQFETFTVAHLADGWTADVGSLGTSIQSTTEKVRGVLGWSFIGDGAELTKVSQALLGLTSRVPLCLNIFTKVDAAPAAGTMIVDLFDGTGVISDDEGTPNTMTIDLTAETTTFKAHSAVFRLPDPVPATVQIRIFLFVALTTARVVSFDEVVLVEADELYPRGPSAAIFAGSVDFAKDDDFTMTVTNDYQGEVQQLFERFFDMQSLGLQLPSALLGTETIPDTVIG